MKIFFLVLTTLAMSENDFSFEDVSLRGSGCPENSTTIVTTPDEQGLSILFDQFISEVPNVSEDNDNDDYSDLELVWRRRDSRLSNKVCNIIITAKIKPGEMLSHFETQVDFRGATYVEEGAIARMKTVFREFKGPRQSRRRSKKSVIINELWDEPTDEDWTLSETLSVPLSTRCSLKKERTVQLVLKNVLRTRIKRNSPESTALVTLDTTDMVGNLKFKLITRPCGQQQSICASHQKWNRRREICVDKRRKLGRKIRRGRLCPPRQRWNRRLNQCVEKRLRPLRNSSHRRPLPRRNRNRNRNERMW